MSELPDTWKAVLRDKPAIGVLATYQPDGEAHLSAVWVDYDDERDVVHLNSERPRRKVQNAEREGRAAILVMDPDNPYRWVSVNGPVEVTEEGAREDIDRLAGKFMGVDEYPNPIQGARVIMHIEPETVRMYDPEG